MCSFDLGSQMTGIGLRCWEIAQILSKVFDVTILTQNQSDFEYENIKMKSFKDSNWEKCIDDADTVFFTALPDARMLLYAHQNKKQIISENAIPIEHLDYHNVRGAADPDRFYQEIMARFKLQLLVTDHFIARSSVERETLLASMGMAGRINFDNYLPEKNLKHMVSYIPIGFNSYSDIYSQEAETDPENIDFIWNGGIWNFYDTSIIPKVAARLKGKIADFHFAFMYSPPKNQFVEEYEILIEEIYNNNVGDCVHFMKNEIPHYKRDSIMKASRVIVCIGKETIENLTCHRLRLRDVFLYSKPIVIDSYGATANIVEMYGLGITVSNDEELENALYCLREDKDLYDQFVNNINRVRKKFLIDDHVDNLIKFIRSSEKARDSLHLNKIPLLDQLIREHPGLINEGISPI